LPFEEFILSTKFVLSSSFFTFEGKIFKQIFGVPIGLPLLAICRYCHTTLGKQFADISIELPIYYLYVDDILLAAPKDRLNILLLIKYHSRLQFTVELEEKHCINFLDLTIKIENNTITLDWFHKASFSGRCLSFFSNPLCYKIGTIYIMMDRTVLLSHPSYHQKNLRLVDTLFNGSSMDFRKIDNRLKYLITTKLNKIPVT